MTDLEITFDQEPWVDFVNSLPDGGTISGAVLLTQLESASEDDVQDVLLELAQRHITLEVDALPQYPASPALAVRLKQEQQWVQKNALLTGPGENDPLRLYLEEIERIPQVNDPNSLAAQLAAGEMDACEPLVNAMLGRVVTLAEEYMGRGVLLMDLIQEASLGLWQGLQYYTDGDITQYCDWWIRQYLAATVIQQARSAGLGQQIRQAMEDYRSVDEKLLSELGRNPTLEEIAEAMHISASEAQIVADMVANARVMNRVHQPEPEELPQEEDQAVEDTAYFQMRQRIEDLLSGLSGQDAQILSLRYGLSGGLPMDAAQVGAKLGLTAQEVNEREAAALAKLRQ